ncbi:MAG: tRNA (adenosine(37)-N6)-dimethylallyltransferase MiaA [Bacteroidales bacterium]|jgi:tRNA dimethylallyltransferase|nr:tRNA (adenosine(37)-N6)-dimethylallyltransferase MiaA [Bacteroidales bacterium]
MQDIPLLCILGPTASGKTHLAVQLAHRLQGEIISADSRQVYKRMDIGTGKDINEYIIDNKQIPYHLIDIVEQGNYYSVYEYHRDFQLAYNDIISRNKIPVLCGGSGMYIEAVISDYQLDCVPVDEEFHKQMEKRSMDELITELKSLKSLHNKTDILDKKRLIRALEIALQSKQSSSYQSNIPNNCMLFYIAFEKTVLRQRIALRLKQRLENGMIDEVKSLLESGVSREDLFYYGLEYRIISQYLADEMDYKTMVSTLAIAIGKFAKRQRTWFNRMRRKGFKILDIDGTLPDSQKVDQILSEIDFKKISLS